MAKQLTIDGSEQDRGPSKPISIYLPPDMREAAQAQADAEGRSLSGFIKWCVQSKLQSSV
jgi:CopG-like RHH_1 or ribbon-helix-helix domain, RHH_5